MLPISNSVLFLKVLLLGQYGHNNYGLTVTVWLLLLGGYMILMILRIKHPASCMLVHTFLCQQHENLSNSARHPQVAISLLGYIQA